MATQEQGVDRADSDPLAQVDNDLLLQARHDPRVHAQLFLRHPARPEDNYDFHDANGETKLNYLLSDAGPLNPQQWGGINILKMHRGGLKTTTVSMIDTWAHQMFLDRGLKTYMSAPREEPPIKDFMNELQQKVEEVGLDNYYETDNQYYQEFVVRREDEYGNTYPVRSKIQADSGYDPDSLRGPHSHIGILDEFQDLSKKAFDTYSHCIDQEIPDVPYFPAIFLIGTPKDETSFFNTLWQQSDQRTWDAERRSWVAQSTAEDYTPSEELLEELPNISSNEVDEGESRPVRGWHLDCFNSPLKSAADIAQFKQNNSKRKFKNEMEAVFYNPADSFLGMSDLEAHFFDDERTFRDRRQSEDTTVIVSADWGGGSDRHAADTVIGAVEYRSLGADDDHDWRGVIRNVQFLPTELTEQEEIQAVEELYQQFDAERGCIDYGHGSKKAEDLQDGNGTHDPNGYASEIKACNFGNISSKSELKWEKDTGKRRFFTCDKTYWYEGAVDAVKSGKYACPSANLVFSGQESKGTKIQDQLTAPEKEFTTTRGGKKKARVATEDRKNDDFADWLVMNYIGFREVGGRTISPTVAGNTRVGV